MDAARSRFGKEVDPQSQRLDDGRSKDGTKTTAALRDDLNLKVHEGGCHKIGVEKLRRI